jgi:hypothetical protein
MNNHLQTLKLLMLHLLRERALITGCRVEKSQLNVNALTVQRGGDAPNQLQDATAVTMEIRTLDPLSVSNERTADLELDLAIAFLMRIMGAGGERARRLRDMFRVSDAQARGGYSASLARRELQARAPRERLLAGGDEPDVDIIDVDEEA